MDRYEHIFGEKGLRRFGEPIGDMRDKRDLVDLQDAGKGFILNLREDRKLLHRAGCEAVGVMSSTAHPKVFFASEESLQWLTVNLGQRGWENCGKCGGSSAPRSGNTDLAHYPATRITGFSGPKILR
jgi:hypothetical protein